MNAIGFPLKDLSRRRFHTIFSFASLTLCVAATISTVLIAKSYGLRIIAVSSGRLNVGFINIFSGFATIITYLSIVTGGVMTYFFVSANMKIRVRDIGIIKAMGCLPDQAFGYFATELFVLVFSSCAVGAVIGVALSDALIHLTSSSFIVSQLSTNIWTISIILLIIAIVALFMGVQPIARAMNAKPAEALFPYYLRGASFKSARSHFTGISSTFKIAYRSFMRRRAATVSTILCLSIALMAMTIAQAGTAITNETAQAYLRGGLGENIVLIGHRDIIAQYTYFLSQPFQDENKTAINYLDSKYSISDTVVQTLTAIPGVKLDPRLFTEAKVYELAAIHVVQESYFVVGDSRSSEAVVFGVNPETVVNNWLINGRTLNKTDKYAAVLGDSLASQILTSPFDERVAILNNNFDVIGVALDPLNAGLVVYVPLNDLAQSANETKYNLVFAKIDSQTYPKVLAKISEALTGTNLKLVELNPVLERYTGFFQSIWSSFTVVSLLFLITVALCLSTEMTLHITEQESELGVMRALGAKPRKVISIIMMQASMNIFVSSAIGISIGLFLSYLFLVQSPIISQSGVSSVALWLLFAVGFLLVFCLYPAIRIARRNLASIIPRLTF
jgi:ABC-type antimicrobial peptide transport system permease subunit